MTPNKVSIQRRTALSWLGGLLALPRGALATRGPFPETPAVLVAGPDGSAVERWASVITPPLARALPSPAMRQTSVGGVDGVTGANQFDTRVPPDGATVLLAPGEAALAWLAGDPRAQFDISRWVPVLAGATPCLIVGRAPLAPDRMVRMVASHVGADLPALLALDLLGVPCERLPGLGEAAAEAAFSQGATDAVFLRGPNVPARLAALTGGRPLFSFGAVDESGSPMRDPAFPDVPHMAELFASLHGAEPSGPLYDAWGATAAASQLAFGLVLPGLTPPALVALWRHAGSAVAAAPELQAMAAATATRALATQAATAGIARIAADPASLLELRRWLAKRGEWRAG